MKADVEMQLPPKKEYVLYAPLSERQRELYDAIASGGLRALLVKEAGEKQGQRAEDEEEDVERHRFRIRCVEFFSVREKGLNELD